MSRPKLKKFWVLFTLHAVLFGAFLFIFLGPGSDDAIKASFSHFEVITTPSSTSQTPQTSPGTGTTKEPQGTQKPQQTQKPTESPPEITKPQEPEKPVETEKPPETQKPKKPHTTPLPYVPQYHPPLPLSVYDSRTGYIPRISSFDFLTMKQAKVTIVELQGTSSFLVKGGVIPIRSVNPLFMCALNTTKLCQSLYPADVIDLLYSFSPIYGWGSQEDSRVLYANHFNFRDYMLSIGVPVVVLEAIYPGQKFLATSPGKEPWEIQLKVEDSFYYRENFLNVAARKTPKWEYLLWIDGHQIFLNTYWWEESIRKLEKYGTVQLFQYLYYMRRGGNWTDMNVNYAGIQYGRYLATPFFAYPDSKRGLWAGNAWGIRREVYNEIGYILDTCVCGWCDSAYNIPTFGEFEDWALFLFPNYKTQLMPWLENAGRVFKKYGYGPAIVRGNMVHFDHERFSKDEIERAQRAIGGGGYNMTTDLYRDENFTLHTYEGSRMATLFTKRKWTN